MSLQEDIENILRRRFGLMSTSRWDVSWPEQVAEEIAAHVQDEILKAIRAAMAAPL